jgi:hypothetical protein
MTSKFDKFKGCLPAPSHQTPHALVRRCFLATQSPLVRTKTMVIYAAAMS